MLKVFQKSISKTCAPTGATVIGCKCYQVQLVIGSTVFHPKNLGKKKWVKKILGPKKTFGIHCLCLPINFLVCFVIVDFGGVLFVIQAHTQSMCQILTFLYTFLIYFGEGFFLLLFL